MRKYTNPNTLSVNPLHTFLTNVTQEFEKEGSSKLAEKFSMIVDIKTHRCTHFFAILAVYEEHANPRKSLTQ